MLITEHFSVMRGTILLNYNENTRQVEEEEKARFLRGILEQCFADSKIADQFHEIWVEDGVLPAPQKVKLRHVLATYGIQVIDDLDGHMRIFLDGDLMAEWFKCTYKLKSEPRVHDPRKRFYLEMEVNCWSVFDAPEEHETE
jgi:hypothetical protein